MLLKALTPVTPVNLTVRLTILAHALRRDVTSAELGLSELGLSEMAYRIHMRRIAADEQLDYEQTKRVLSWFVSRGYLTTEGDVSLDQDKLHATEAGWRHVAWHVVRTRNEPTTPTTMMKDLRLGHTRYKAARHALARAVEQCAALGDIIPTDPLIACPRFIRGTRASREQSPVVRLRAQLKTHGIGQTGRELATSCGVHLRWINASIPLLHKQGLDQP